MSELRLADVVAALVATRDRLQEKVGHADVAIEALGKLLAADGAPAPARALPAAPRAPRSAPPAAAGATDRKGHRVYGDERPRTTVCRNERCGKAFPVKGPGRVPHYCSDVCRTAAGKRLRAAIATKSAPAAAPERRRMPRADRPVDDAELDSLLERSKRGHA